MRVCLTLTLTPTLCSMLLDPLLKDRYYGTSNGSLNWPKEKHTAHIGRNRSMN